MNASPRPGTSNKHAFRRTSTHAMRTAGIVLLLVAAASACSSPSTASVGGTSSAPTGPTGTPLVAVPRIIGSSLKVAKSKLEKTRLSLGEITKKYSHEDAGTVLRVSLDAGSNVTEGTAIALVIAQTYPKLPNVVGLTAAKATAQLKSAGYKVSVTKATSSHTPGTVISMAPAAGSELLPGKTVRIVVAKAAPPPCNPNYSGACIPNVSYDLNCSDVSATNFHVVGYDQYGFDGDGDGIACEG
jgi:beta-lactam-binding protein with PASTA domain